MEPGSHISSRKLILIALSLLIISLGLLMFQIAPTRVFSVILAYHYVFTVVSVALLGLSIGAVFFRFIRSKVPPSMALVLGGVSYLIVSFVMPPNKKQPLKKLA